VFTYFLLHKLYSLKNSIQGTGEKDRSW